MGLLMRLGSDWLSSAEGVRKPLHDLPDTALRLRWDHKLEDKVDMTYPPTAVYVPWWPL
jgi:hypothetical protein